MTAGKRREFDVVIVESLDRLSRDDADLPNIRKRLNYWGIQIHTVNDGIATPMHTMIRAFVGRQQLKDISDKVHRHHIGRIMEGKFMGAVTYGYCRVLGEPDADGTVRFKSGIRGIDPAKAAVVRRIFTEYVNGRSPRAIAGGLTADRILSPSGRDRW